MPAAGDAAVLFARGRWLPHVMQQGRRKHNLALNGIKLAPPRVFNQGLANHPCVSPDVAFSVIDRVLRAILHIARELKLAAERVPTETPIGRLWREKKVHHSISKMSGILVQSVNREIGK